METGIPTLSDEDALREQLRTQADEAERKETRERAAKAEQTARGSKDPFERQARNEIPKVYQDMENQNRELVERNKDLQRQIDNITENLLKKNDGSPADLSKLNGGPVNDAHSNLGGAISSQYVKYALQKLASGEWDEEDIERYLFVEAGWVDKAHVRARQIASLFHKKKKP